MKKGRRGKFGALKEIYSAAVLYIISTVYTEKALRVTWRPQYPCQCAIEHEGYVFCNIVLEGFAPLCKYGAKYIAFMRIQSFGIHSHNHRPTEIGAETKGPHLYDS